MRRAYRKTCSGIELERHITGPPSVRVPLRLQRELGLPGGHDRARDLTLEYREVVFSEPQDVLILPASITTTTVLRGGLQSTRRTHHFSGYQRFLSGGRIRR